MTTTEAAKLLEVSPDIAPDQLETRFLELRAKLEDKIAKAPTAGLKAKYRETLDQVTQAFEVLTLAGDSSSLPVLQKQSADDPPSPGYGAASGGQRTEDGGQTSGNVGSPLAGGPSAARPQGPALQGSANPKSRIQNRKSGREFLLVALIAVVVLAAGGWFVMKTRADKAEQARIAAEAEVKRQADEAEKVRLAAEKARRTSQLRTELAAAQVAWEAVENRLRAAERQAADVKSEARGLRDAPAWRKAELSALAQRHELYANWLNEHLAGHPAKVARVTAGQLVSDGLLDEAAAALAEMQAEMSSLVEFMSERSQRMLEGVSEVTIHSQPEGVKFVFTDAYGRTTEGVTPATLKGQPLSDLHDPRNDGAVGGDTEIPVGEFRVEPSVRFIRPGWADVVKSGRTLLSGATFTTEYAEGGLRVTSQPVGVPYEAVNALGWKSTGMTPAALAAVPPGPVTVSLGRPGFQPVSGTVTVPAGKTATLALDQRSQSVQFTVAEAKSKIFVDGKFAGYETAVVNDLTPGEHALQIEAAGYAPYRTKFTVKQEATTQAQKFSFQQLAVENLTCGNCKGAGSFARAERCNTCRGQGRLRCQWCEGKGGRNTIDILTRQVTGWVNCEQCRGSRMEDCNSCDRGTYRWSETCTTCGGDGRVSRLQLAQ